MSNQDNFVREDEIEELLNFGSDYNQDGSFSFRKFISKNKMSLAFFGLIVIIMITVISILIVSLKKEKSQSVTKSKQLSLGSFQMPVKDLVNPEQPPVLQSFHYNPLSIDPRLEEQPKEEQHQESKEEQQESKEETKDSSNHILKVINPKEEEEQKETKRMDQSDAFVFKKECAMMDSLYAPSTLLFGAPREPYQCTWF